MCHTDDTIQDFQFKSFRFSGQDSGSVYLHVRAKVCLADDESSECYLYCYGPLPCASQDRKRRSVNQNPRNNSADNPYPKPYFVDIGPIRVAEEQKGISYCYSVDIVLISHNNEVEKLEVSQWKAFRRGGGMRVSIAYNLCYLGSIFLHVNLHD